VEKRGMEKKGGKEMSKNFHLTTWIQKYNIIYGSILDGGA
jgi:hypothetical protein